MVRDEALGQVPYAPVQACDGLTLKNKRCKRFCKARRSALRADVITRLQARRHC
jgi:hypothetical protein